MLTYLALRNANVSIVKTIAAPLCYTPNAKPNPNFMKEVALQLGFPLVAKKSYGSFGAGVQLVYGMEELEKVEDEWLHVPHIYQTYVEESAGRDVRVIVIGGKTIATMERVAQEGEFRSNVELGGIGREILIDDNYKKVAEEVAKVLKLDYCGVDLLEGKDGAIVCEVNSNAFFEGLEKTTRVNVAKAYAQYIVGCL